MLENYYVIPLFAVLANLGCLMLNLGRDHPFHRLMVAFYAVVAIFNFSTVMLCLSHGEEEALFWWKYFNATSWMTLAPLAVGMVSFASGRNILALPTIVSATLSFLAGLLLLVMPRIAFIGAQTHEFGQGPVLSTAGNVFGAIPHIAAIAISIFLLVRPMKWNVFFGRGFFSGAILIWWLALFANFPATSGLHVPPLHPFADGIVSILLAVYLNRRSIGVSGPVIIASNILISVSIGLLAGMLINPWLASFPQGVVVTLAGSGLVATAFLSFLGYRQQIALGSDVIPLGLSEYGLSRQEVRICELIQDGHSRSFIQLVLNVSNGTLRNHLKHIYAKVLPAKSEKASTKDQLQRLTVILAKRSTSQTAKRTT